MMDRVWIDRVRLVTAMAQADIDRATLAKRASLDPSTISMVKAGKSCKRQTGEKIAAGLGVELETLLREV